MKRDGFKRSLKGPKTRIKTRESLAELHFNNIEPRTQLKKRGRAQPFHLLPHNLHIHILSFLSAKELLYSVQLLSRSWNSLANEPIVWQWLESAGLAIKQRVKFLKCLVERRSKGKVYRGVLRSTLEPVTVREVYLDVTNAGFDDGVPTSLLREISYLSEIDHPNIAKLLVAEVRNRVLHICTEQGEYNLKDYMRKFGQGDAYKMPKRTIAMLTKQLLTALNYMSHRGYMHRNLKPDNVLVSKTGTLKLTDFTLARLVGYPLGTYTPEDPKERDRSGREARRLWYRAPELLLRKTSYSFEVDMWTVGCLLAELCTGVPLFSGENEIEQLFKIFKFVGMPHGVYPVQEATFPAWGQVRFTDILCDRTSSSYKELVAQLVPTRENTFKTLHKMAILGRAGLDLLQKCLEPDPSKRITANSALSHPFVKGTASLCCAAPDCGVKSHLEFYQSLESSNMCKGCYLSSQPSITAPMRSILVDWLIDVGVHFEVTNETLHLAIGLTDRVLSVLPIDRSKLQLIGVTCMKLADVLNEKSKEYYRQENSIEYAYITADEYSPAEVVAMEKQVLSLLNFKTTTPTILTFLNPYMALLLIGPETATVALYISDVLLLNYETILYKPSVLASAALYLACCTTDSFPALDLLPSPPQYTETQFQQTTNYIRTAWLQVRSSPHFSRFESINNKYEHINPQSLWPPATHSREWLKLVS